MALLKEISEYIDTFLQVDRFKDYCPNGLQIEVVG
jgi:putative NIF3 family GTP cyclohydrolase 1 type 2